FLAPPLPLLAFPTRRSSDLSSLHGVGVALAGTRPDRRPFRRRSNQAPETEPDFRLPHPRISLRVPTPTSPRPSLAHACKAAQTRSEEHTSELQSRVELVCRL